MSDRARRLRFRRAVMRRRRRRETEKARPTAPVWVWGGFAAVLVVLGLIGGAAGAVYFVYQSFADDLVDPEAILDTQRALGTSRVFDREGRDGALLFEFADPLSGLRDPVRLSEVSQFLVDATVATEDASFWENEGINLRGLLRAAWENVGFGESDFLGGSGGSSITQQLVKNVLIPPEERSGRTVERARGKLKESILAIEVTDQFSKEQILEWYLNTIFYGNHSYGIGAASQQYFGKAPSELSLPEAALLAGLPQAPAVFDPYGNLPAAKARQAVVLDLMVRHGLITRPEADEAKEAPLRFASTQFDILAPHFVFYVRDQVVALCERGRIPLPDTVLDCSQILAEGGLRITTTLDLELQRKAEEILRVGVESFEDETGARNASLVTLDPRNGEIRAMVGSRDFFREDIDGQVNLATAANSPGSSIKPLTYLAAFLLDPRQWNPATIIWDVPLEFHELDGTTFAPTNFDDIHRGPLTIRSALANSVNIPAFRVADAIGIPYFLEVAHRIGITTMHDASNYGPSITLGGGDVTLLDMAYAYSVIANNGLMLGQRSVLDLPPGYRELDPVAVLEIRDSRGRLLYQYESAEERQVIPAPQAFQVTSVLSDNNARSILYGFNSTLVIDRPAAAKTGTAGEPGREDVRRDFWTVGFTPDLVTAVWVGNADNTPMTGGSSSRTAGQIWHDFMLAAHEGLPPAEFVEPQGLVRSEVFAPAVRTLFPGEDRAAVAWQDPCSTSRRDLFVAERGIPQRDNGVCFETEVDARTLLPAAAETPEAFVREDYFLLLPLIGDAETNDPEIEKWLRGNKVRFIGDGESSEDLVPLRIDLPRDGAELGRGLLLVRGKAISDEFERFTLAFAPGESPANAEFTDLLTSENPIRSGQLTRWNTEDLEPGPYTLRLTLLDTYLGEVSVDARVVIEGDDEEEAVEPPAEAGAEDGDEEAVAGDDVAAEEESAPTVSTG